MQGAWKHIVVLATSCLLAILLVLNRSRVGGIFVPLLWMTVASSLYVAYWWARFLYECWGRSMDACVAKTNRKTWCNNPLGRKWFFCHDHRAWLLDRIKAFLLLDLAAVLGWAVLMPHDPSQADLQLRQQYCTQYQFNNSPYALARFHALPASDGVFRELCKSLSQSGAFALDFSDLPKHNLQIVHLKIVAREFDNLMLLNVEHNTKIEDTDDHAAADAIRSCGGLRVLKLQDTGLQDAHFLRSLNKLEEVSLSGVEFSQDDFEALSELRVLHIKDGVSQKFKPSNRKLELLDLKGGSLASLSISDVVQLTKLRIIGTHLPELAITNLPILREVEISDTNMETLSIIDCARADSVVLGRNAELRLLLIARCGTPHEVILEENRKLRAIVLADTLANGHFNIRDSPVLAMMFVSGFDVLSRLDRQDYLALIAKGMVPWVRGRPFGL